MQHLSFPGVSYHFQQEGNWFSWACKTFWIEVPYKIIKLSSRSSGGQNRPHNWSICPVPWPLIKPLAASSSFLSKHTFIYTKRIIFKIVKLSQKNISFFFGFFPDLATFNKFLKNLRFSKKRKYFFKSFLEHTSNIKIDIHFLRTLSLGK